MLRATSRQQILNTIEQSYFGSSNFIIKFSEGNPTIFSISFIPNQRFSFEFQTLNRTYAPSHKYITVEAPGDRFLTPDKYQFDDVDESFLRLSRWLERVKEEIVTSNPFAKEIAELRDQLEAKISELDTDLEGFFTATEASAMSERLDELSRKLNELQNKNEKLELDLDHLNQVIIDLSSAASVLNKGTWYRMASGRLLSGLKSLAKSKEARELALEAAKKFLLEGPK